MKSNEQIRNEASVAIDLIEIYTSRTVWKTANRIHELIKLNHSSWQNNAFLMHRQNIIYLLGKFCGEDSFVSADFHSIHGEVYEESQHEPVLLEDTYFARPPLAIPDNLKYRVTPYEPINVRTIIVEREIYKLMKQGMEFEEANLNANTIQPEDRERYMQEFNNKGMLVGNVYYRHTTGSHDKKIVNLPALTAD